MNTLLCIWTNQKQIMTIWSGKFFVYHSAISFKIPLVVLSLNNTCAPILHSSLGCQFQDFLGCPLPKISHVFLLQRAKTIGIGYTKHEMGPLFKWKSTLKVEKFVNKVHFSHHSKWLHNTNTSKGQAKPKSYENLVIL